MDDKYELEKKMISSVSMASTFGQLGGDADEFIRFLQLEWESFDRTDEGEEFTELKRQFYRNIRQYQKYRNRDRNWRIDFDGRDFNDLLV